MTRLADSTASEAQKFPGYTVLSVVAQSLTASLYRVLQIETQQIFLLKVPADKAPDFTSRSQIFNQYAVTKDVTHQGILRPVSLLALGDHYGLLLEDFSGIPLSQYLQTHSLVVPECLQVAIQLAEILHVLHCQRVVHQDMNPANILINPKNKRVVLGDFGIASLLPKETHVLQSPSYLEGALAYLAPEQTGRMNRGIDYRTDFYALGITLYQLCSGRLPYPGDDPLQVVYSHIAQTPTPLNQLNHAVSELLTAIVAKLMAKNAEDRYQTARGLQYDLEQCLAHHQGAEESGDFVLGQRDVSDRFLIPEKLYGHQAEVQSLLSAFERVVRGGSEFMLLEGSSGIGKTAVVNEIQKPITRQRGYFVQGKFDQFSHNLPFSGFSQAFRSLVRQLLGETDATLLQRKSELLQALGDNAQTLLDLVPELHQFLGAQSKVMALSGTAAQNRFTSLISRFVQVFAKPDHPLVLFLDDLQWIDSASLDLLKFLVTESHLECFLIVGAYRHDEVPETHPLALSLEEIARSSAPCSVLTLGPISFDEVNQLVAETLSCGTYYAHPLAQLVYQKTCGNPFFIRQLLQGLYEDGLITFNSDLGHWECLFARIGDALSSESVVEFIAARIHRLPLETQKVLQLGACIGYQFDVKTLSIICQQAEDLLVSHLWEALKEGFLLPIGAAHQFLQGELRPAEDQLFRFLHDRIQQAAYGLIPESQKQQVHFQIGQLLIQQASEDIESDRLFELTSHLNYGADLIVDQVERDEIARLNLKAARAAQKATAYQAGLAYAEMGLLLLGSDAWQRQYQLVLVLHELAAEFAFLCGDIARMTQLIGQTRQHAQSWPDQVNVVCLTIQFYVTQTQFAEAVDTARQCLRNLGLSFPVSPTREDTWQGVQLVEKLLGDTDIAELCQLPPMSDQAKLGIVQVISSVIPAAYISGSPLFSLWTVLATQLSIQFGNSPASSYIYINYSYLLCHYFQLMDVGEAFGQLALKLLDEIDAVAARPKVLIMFGLYTLHRKALIQKTLPLLKEGYDAALEVGNYEWVGYGAYALCANAFLCSQDLLSLEQDIRQYSTDLHQIRQVTPFNWCQIYGQSVLNLRGLSDEPTALSGEMLSEADFFETISTANDWLGLFYFHLYKVILTYLFGQNESARCHAVSARKYLIVAGGTVGMPLFYFYDALSAIQELVTLEPTSKDYADLLQQVDDNCQKLQQNWASHAPMNYQHKVDLVEAEKLRLAGQYVDAMDCYEKAILGAKENYYCQDEALANELAAKFYWAWHKQTIAEAYVTAAYEGYERWGAKAKADDLEKHYGKALASFLQSRRALQPLEALASSVAERTLGVGNEPPTPNVLITDDSSLLDFSAVLQAAQLLSEKIQLDDLLVQLVELLLHNSGADHLAVVLPNREGVWRVRAMATSQHTQLLDVSLTDQENLPINLIQYVKNTQEVITIDRFDDDTLPVMDLYLQRTHPCSVFCLPILYQGHLIGLLYLQNQSTAGVFSRDRILVIQFICTQAAIALENARVYDLEKAKNQQLSQLNEQLSLTQCSVDRSSEGIFWSTRDRRIVNANPAACKMLGYSLEELRQLSISDINPDVAAGKLGEYWSMLKSQGYALFESRHQAKDGRIYPVEISANYLEFSGKEYCISTVRDISDRKSTERMLKMFQYGIQNSSDGILWVTSEASIVYANPAICSLLGYSEAELTALSIFDIDPNLLEENWHPLWDMTRRCNARMLESRYQAKGGQCYPVEIVATYFELEAVEYAFVRVRDISDRKQAEADLQLSEARAKAAFDQAAVGVVESTLFNRKIARANDHFCQMTGYAVSELRDLTAADLTHPDDLLASQHKLQQLYQGELDSFVLEKRYLRKDGSYFWASTTVSLIQNSVEDHPRCVAVIQDISDRKRSEAALQQSEARATAVFNQATIGILETHLPLVKLVRFNDYFCELLGYERSELEGKALLELTYADDIPDCVRLVEALNAGDINSLTMEKRYVRKDGSLVWVLLSATMIEIPAEGQSTCFAMLQDISERRQAEEALRAQQNHLAALLDNIPHMAWIKDSQSRFIAVNQPFGDACGRSPEELVGQTDYDIWPSELAQAYRADDFQVLKSGQRKVVEEAISLVDGALGWLETTKTPIKGTQDQFVGTVGIAADISQRKAAEAEVQQANEQLALSNQQLRHATRLKDEFLTTMSHELRTPLNAILGMTESLQEKIFGDVTTRQLDALNLIEHSSNHLLALINDILDLSKIEADKIELSLVSTDIAHLCYSSLLLVQQQAQQKNINVQPMISSNLPRVVVDEKRIRQVLLNLLTNAVKFTPVGGQISFTVSLKLPSAMAEEQTSTGTAVDEQEMTGSPQFGVESDLSEHQNKVLYIAVKDTGIGIGAGDIGKLFQPFVQIDGALNRKYEGTGLGLALVKKIVELHGGHVSVESEVGVGSQFTVELPYSAPPPAPTKPAAARGGEQTGTMAETRRSEETGSPLVLLVEDDAANVMTIASYLEAKGYRLAFAENGEEALNQVQALAPQAILMDIQMPVMDGLEATRRIRQDLELRQIPIIALTALAMKGDEERCLAAGANEYLSKPVRLKQLDALLQKYLLQ